MVNNEDELEMYSNLGFNLIAVGTEMSILSQGMSNLLK
jgi:2-keto-3-deoxy-L-rhamnonate aldolase RhmA